MEIQSTLMKRSHPVLVRLTPVLFNKLAEISKEAGGGVATTIRSILEAAVADGVEVVASDEELIPEPVERVKRRRG